MANESFELEITELRLGCGSIDFMEMKNEKKRVFSEIISDRNSSTEDERGLRKKQLVGWPPVCSYRRKNGRSEMTKKYIKVSMDGAPILRKVDLSTYFGYEDLAKAVEMLFGTCFGLVDKMKNRDNFEYMLIYEDRDEDWMLVGDVPWEMFIESCKRLRIMKKSEVKSRSPSKKLLKGTQKND